MAFCTKCGKENSHYCEREDRYVSKSDPLVSAAVAAVTDSTLLGWAIGGSLTGAILGDILGGDDD